MTKGSINFYFTDRRWPSKEGTSDLFDWLVIDHYDLFAKALVNKLDDFFEKKDFIDANGIFTPTNQKYMMHWVHMLESEISKDFENDKKLEVFNNFFERDKSKMQYLKEKFINSKNKKTVYIFNEANFCVNMDAPIKIRNALNVVRDGNKDFILLWVTICKKFDDLENILVREDPGILDLWADKKSVGFCQILDEFKFTPDIWA
ncbi:MAG: hypothetical protein Q8S21_01530 [Candidatus Paracaedibacteraceae bacterium]|nr:hypothetical protein [Candidatus Paracaedibacteraceae bacterium]